MVNASDQRSRLRLTVPATPYRSVLRRGLLFLFFSGVPGADAEKAENVHLIDLAHPPAAFQQIVVGGIDEFRQRQDSAVGFTGSTVGVFSSAAFVGNSSRISVVWVCTAISARAMSCIRRSTG